MVKNTQISMHYAMRIIRSDISKQNLPNPIVIEK